MRRMALIIVRYCHRQKHQYTLCTASYYDDDPQVVARGTAAVTDLRTDELIEVIEWWNTDAISLHDWMTKSKKLADKYD